MVYFIFSTWEGTFGNWFCMHMECKYMSHIDTIHIYSWFVVSDRIGRRITCLLHGFALYECLKGMVALSKAFSLCRDMEE